MKRGDIYWAKLEPVLAGSEQGGSRPVLIIQNDAGNCFSSTVIVACCAGRKANYLPVHVPVEGDFLHKPTDVYCEQLRTISKERLVDKMGELTEAQLKRVDAGLLISLGLEKI